MEFLAEYGLFLAQAVTVVAAIGVIIILVASVGQRQKQEPEGHIELHKLNERYREMQRAITDATTDPDLLKESRKAQKKADKKEAKEKAKAAKKQRRDDQPQEEKPHLYVLDFDGDIRASAVDQLREEVSALLAALKEGDEILLRLESPGGLVHSYGLAASQLQRIRASDHKLTVAVDKVAASGGYMMACVADRIVAAPFAILGSIGVLAQIPNFHRLLKKNDIDFELITAGEHKRTLTVFGENTEKGREKFREDIEETHTLFKNWVAENRPEVPIDTVATGEVWYGQRAVDVQLVDELQTSDDFIQERLESHGVYELKYVRRKNWQQKLGLAAEGALERSLLRVWQTVSQRPPH